MGKIVSAYYGEQGDVQNRDVKYQAFKVPPDTKNIGKRRVYRKDGWEKASGKALFTKDVLVPGMIYAKIMASPYGHAKIKSMDTAAAEALPGVRYILKYDDPDLKGHQSSIQSGKNHNPIDSVAHFYPQPVACAVAADTPDICDEALRLVKIEWEELPVILEPEDALKTAAVIVNPEIKKDSNQLKDQTLNVGDVEAGFKEADQVIEWSLKMQETNGATAEGGCTVARWSGDYLDIWAHTQTPHEVIRNGLFAVPIDKINMEILYQGAMFGGLNWMSYSKHQPWVATVLAKKSGLPVKLLWDEQHWYGSDYGHGYATFKAGFKKDGTITAVSIDNIQAMQGVVAGYDDPEKQSSVKNWRGRGRQANISRGPQMCFRDSTVYSAYNCIIWQKVAAALKVDPQVVCEKNQGAYGETWEELREWRTHMGFDADRNSLKEVFAAAKKAIGWDSKWHAPGAKILPNGRYHGIGVQWSHQWTNMKRPSFASLLIHGDGTVNIMGRHADIGCNHETACCQIVADELGVPYDMVSLRPFSGAVGYELQAPGGSSNMVANGPTMVRLARKAKAMLLELACQPVNYGPAKFEREYAVKPALFPGKKPEELDVKDGVIFEKANPANKIAVATVAGTHWTTSRENMVSEPVIIDDYTPPIDWRPACCQQVHMVEVEVDPETGFVEVVKMACVNDVGKAINPDTVNGQQYGGAYMGVSRSRQELIYYDPVTGVKLNDDLIQYPVALMNDFGPIECRIVETGQAYGAYGSTGIGENIGVIMTTAMNDAIYNATGKWIDDIATTPEKVLKLLGKA
jgi:CO/xanthine dehydrogenase Mo-binding subunit